MFDQTLTNLTVCLMISQKHTKKLHTTKLACCSQNEFEMKLAKKNRIEEEPLKYRLWISPRLITFHYNALGSVKIGWQARVMRNRCLHVKLRLPHD